jgi:hypothetical protein
VPLGVEGLFVQAVVAAPAYRATAASTKVQLFNETPGANTLKDEELEISSRWGRPRGVIRFENNTRVR